MLPQKGKDILIFLCFPKKGKGTLIFFFALPTKWEERFEIFFILSTKWERYFKTFSSFPQNKISHTFEKHA
jgi:hypothetical protein